MRSCFRRCTDRSRKRATVGTGVVPIYSRNVAALSLSAAAAAEAADGRFILGLGAGHQFPTQAWYEAKWERPRARLREMIEVLRAILAGERVTHNGSLNINGFHLGSTPPAVPIYVAALSPASLRLAGEVADGVILNWLPPEGIEKRHCSSARRPPMPDGASASSPTSGRPSSKNPQRNTPRAKRCASRPTPISVFPRTRTPSGASVTDASSTRSRPAVREPWTPSSTRCARWDPATG